MLKSQKRINFEFHFDGANYNISPIIFGEFNSKSFCIDCLDGYNWISGSILDNLSYFERKIKSEFIFKRNYNSLIVPLKPNSKIIPFGFNYALGLKNPMEISFYNFFFRNPFWALRYFRLLSGYYDYRSFEAKPEMSFPLKFIFQVRLWDPSFSNDKANASQRALINEFRIDCVRILRRNFGENCFAGVEDSALAQQMCPELILSPEETARKNYFQLIRKASVGIATNGLHNSIGWKIGEYIAASRAIISERPYFLFPTEFKEGQNYFGFSSPDELATVVDKLLSSPRLIQSMMLENQYYYNTYQRPDKLVWNILCQMI